MKNIWDELPKPYFVLAPMDDVTDTVFRRMVADCAAPDLFFTEFVNVDGLQSPGRQRLLNRLQFTARETPLIAQIWGKTPENYYQTAKELADGTFAYEIYQSIKEKNPELAKVLYGDARQGDGEQRTEPYQAYGEGVEESATQSSASSNSSSTHLISEDGITLQNFAGIDLNFGCPDKAVVKNGCCVALVNDRSLAKEIIQATKEGASGRLPVSVKTRLGFNEVDYTWPEFLLQQDIAALTMHGRTRKQMSKVPADWEAIRRVRELRDELHLDTPIIGNGDVMSYQQGIELASQHQLDGIMIGRGIFHDPYVFAKDSPWQKWSAQKKLELYRKHIELFNQTWGDKGRHVRVLNKFCKVYINDFANAKAIRDQLMRAQSISELQEGIKQARSLLS